MKKHAELAEGLQQLRQQQLQQQQLQQQQLQPQQRSQQVISVANFSLLKK